MSTPRPGPAPDYAVLRWLVAATFVVILNETITINAIPRLMADFGVDATAAQWLATAFLLTMAVVIPITGWFLQRVTTRRAFALAMGVFCLGTLLAAAAPTFGVLLLARVVQASGTAVMLPLLMTTLMAVVHEADRGRVMGNVTLAISVAPALGPAVSGVVLQVLSWRWIFLLVLPVAAGVALAGLRRLVDVGEPSAGRVDWLSVLLSAVGFGSLVYGLSELGAAGERGTASVLLVVGLLGLAVFVRRQVVLQRADRPLLDLRTLRVRVFALAVAAMSVAFMAMLGSLVLLQLYLQNLRGLSPLVTGLLVMPGGLAMGLLGPRVGRLFDVHGARVLVVPGALGLLVGMGSFVLVGPSTPVWQVLASHVVLMVGLAALFPPLFTLSLGSLPARLYSHGSSVLGTSQQVAGAVGTALVVMVMSSRTASALSGGASAAQARLEGVRWAFAVGAGLGVVVLVLVLLLPRRTSATVEPGTATVGTGTSGEGPGVQERSPQQAPGAGSVG